MRTPPRLSAEASLWNVVSLPHLVLVLGLSLGISGAHAQARIWRCGNTHTNDEAQAKAGNCKLVEGGNVTIRPGTLNQRQRKGQPAPPASPVERQLGSGFFVAPNAILTNRHVVSGCTTAVVVVDEVRRTGKIERSSKTQDVALVKLDQPVPNVVPASVRVVPTLGEPVLVAGYPLAGILGSDLIVTNGIVNSLAGIRDDNSMMQISAPVQPGNSGGPVLDGTGQVVGMVVSKLNAAKVMLLTGDVPQNVNFAIKPWVLRGFLQESGVPVQAPKSFTPLSGPALASRARDMTVKISCEKANH